MAWSTERISYVLMAVGWGLFFVSVVIVFLLEVKLYWVLAVSWVIGSTGMLTFGYCFFRRLFRRRFGKH